MIPHLVIFTFSNSIKFLVSDGRRGSQPITVDKATTIEQIKTSLKLFNCSIEDLDKA